MKTWSWLALIASLLLAPALAARSAPSPDAAAAEARLKAIADRLHPQTGDISLPAANVVLHLGQDYYFLPADEARLVLTEAWGNPAEATQGVLGMVFPTGRTFADDTWGAVISFEASGYVSDSDAESTDYGELLSQIQAGEAELNRRRTAAGFPAQHLVGWAQPPAYDRTTHSVVWAQNIQFTGQRENSLNYDIRMLGRRGVLSLNMVTVMSQLVETRTAAANFSRAAEFRPGERYADFQTGDRVAEYGVGGLVAAGVGATLAQKAGLFAIVLAFLKKAGVFILAGLALLWRRIAALFGWGGGDDEVAYTHYEQEEAAPEPAAGESAAPADPREPPPSA